MSEQVQVQQSRRRRKHARPTKVRAKSSKLKLISVRYKYHLYTKILTKDVGTFDSMWKKYGDKYEFYCADLPPIFNGGIYEGYHLTHQPDQAKRWGKHKAWIDPNYKVDGKPVVLVWKADSSVTCEDCGLESKTVPKGKRCPRCKKREFIYLNGNTEEHLDFRTPKDIEKEQVESFHDTLGGYMHGAY